MGVRGVVEDVTSQGREHEGRETGEKEDVSEDEYKV